jgi:hypothetical protein
MASEHTPTITTSYFSSGPFGSKVGLRRGTGGANDGSTRKSREEVENSVNTGIFDAQLECRRRTRQYIQTADIPKPRDTCDFYLTMVQNKNVETDQQPAFSHRVAGYRI